MMSLWLLGQFSVIRFIDLHSFFFYLLQPPGGCKGMYLLDCNQTSITPIIVGRSAILLLVGPHPLSEPVQVVAAW